LGLTAAQEDSHGFGANPARSFGRRNRKTVAPAADKITFDGAFIFEFDAVFFKTRSATGAPAAILTTDCGAEMDDQWALAHLLLSTELDLRAVMPDLRNHFGMRRPPGRTPVLTCCFVFLRSSRKQK
jgi:hypothetical protein